ncbi:hypothetical protein O3G_MSEX014129 [Manduca sexta]|uniref:Cuticle protein n=1 Tax=Manduca sexta TaxID=7130 RepID=A0A921ZUB1_MANSE|nr:hypothetical protein O3G_MSEX014129 [Manduca sexta]KAG6463887.1 hypothetical protein O3G_MSEX014129 [Manduca sexta]KAG6463888.1 hypothetical protein O3G_MSEX014129 [Manduca sexta]KAG6463889.1 hypothetical protein O3G_MSEX014129 [Manduca sexta]
MKMFIPLLCLLSFTIAEPPVGDSYASARSSHDYDNHDFQRSPSQQYGTPSQILASRNSFNEYGPPKSKSSTTLSSTYGLPTTRISEDYAVPSARNFPKFSQDYGVPDTRSLSQEYGIPETRNIALEYGVPSRKSQNYGTSKSQNALSRGYATKSRNAVSQEYGVPKVRSQSQEYGTPAQNSLQGYGIPSALPNQFSKPVQHSLSNIENPSALYGSPHSQAERLPKPRSQYLPQRSISKSIIPKSSSNDGASNIDLSYGVPSSSDYSEGFSDFGARVSEYIGSSKSLSQNYGAPSALKTNAVASSYSSVRSPSSTYGAPSTRDAAPSEAYGVPEQYNARSSQGYEYARAGDEDNQEPANYDFNYKVNDYITGSDFGHSETRQDNRAEGTYFVVLPDGTKQVVEYEADERGFKPRISVEPALRSGYDDNAADLTASDGHY